MKGKGQISNIEKIKEQVINTSLVVVSIAGTLTYMLSLISKLSNHAIGIALVFDTFALVSVIIATIKRKYLSNQFKAQIVIFLILLLSFADAFFYGIFSTSRIFLVMIPLYTIIYFTFWHSVIVYFFVVAGFLCIGYLHHAGLVQLIKGFEPLINNRRMLPWLTAIMDLSLVAMVIIFITYKFNISFSNLLKDYEKRNLRISEKERNYREIFNSTKEAIFIHDAESGKIIDVNDIMLQMFGFESKEEVINSNVSIISSNTDSYTEKTAFEYIKKATLEGPQLFEWLAVKKNGEQLWIEVSLRNSEIGGVGRVLAVVRDITERKEADLKIAASEKKFREMSELLPQTVFESDTNGKITYINTTGLEIFQLTEQDIINGRNIFSHFSIEEKEKAIANFGITLSGSAVSSNQYLALRKDGTHFHSQVFSKPIFQNDKVIGLRGIVVDITERILAEEAIRQSEEKYRTLMESMNEVVIMVDNDDRVQYVNKRFTEKLGYLPNEILGEIGFKLLANPDDQDFIQNTDHELIDNLVHQYEVTFLSKKGNKINFLLNSAPFYNAQGIKSGFILALVDITERKRVENALIESQIQFQTLSQLSPVGIFRTREDGYTTYVNPKWTELSGLSFEQAIGDGWLKAVYPDDKEKLYKKWEDDSQNGTNSTTEYRFLRPDGSIVWVLGNALPEIVDGKLTGYIGTITDISKIKIIEKELEKYRNHLESLVKARTDELSAINEELKMNNEELLTQREVLEMTVDDLKKAQKQLVHSEKMASLGILAAGIGHEINNPLNFIYGGLLGIEEYISHNLKEHYNDLQPMLNGIQEGIRRASAIVTSLSHYSRRDDLPMIECDIHSIIDNCLVMLYNQLKHKIEIVKNYTEKKYVLIGNEGKLHQAVLNIIANSAQSIDVEGKIEISTLIEGKILKLIIKDNGCGISLENMPKILDPFFTTKAPGKGTGLGLSITYNIIQEHKGNIEFHSIPGKGTEAIITLPVNRK